MKKKAKVPKPPKGYGIVRGKAGYSDFVWDPHFKEWLPASKFTHWIGESLPYPDPDGTWYLARKIRRKPASSCLPELEQELIDAAVALADRVKWSYDVRRGHAPKLERLADTVNHAVRAYLKAGGKVGKRKAGGK